MKEWIPLLQSLVWPLFLIGFLFSVRGWIREILKVIKHRIETGSEMSVGPSGFSLGSAPKMEPISESHDQELLKSIETEDTAKESYQSISPNLAQSIYLIHGASYFKQAGPSYDRRDFFTVEVQLAADNPSLLDRIDKVVYFRHPSFKDKTILEVTDRESNYRMITRVWGQFNLRAEVYFKGIKEPLILYRYLNF